MVAVVADPQGSGGELSGSDATSVSKADGDGGHLRPSTPTREEEADLSSPLTPRPAKRVLKLDGEKATLPPASSTPLRSTSITTSTQPAGAVMTGKSMASDKTPKSAPAPLPSPSPSLSAYSVSGASTVSEAESVNTSASLATGPPSGFPFKASGSSGTASAGSDASSSYSSNSSNSRWRAQLEMSLPTQRRLIRKPLPELPGSESQIGGIKRKGGSGGSKEQDTVKKVWTQAELEQMVQTWWPEELPPLDEHFTHGKARLSDAYGESSEEQASEEDEYERDLAAQGLGPGLDLDCEEHLKKLFMEAWASPSSILGYSYRSGKARRSESSSAPAEAKDPSPETDGFDAGAGLSEADDEDPLQETTAPQLYHSTLSALRSLSAPATMAALQRTAAMRWRAEMQLRSALAGSSTGDGNATPGKSDAGFSAIGMGLAAGYGALAAKGWAKFGWPAAALAKAGGFGSLSGNAGGLRDAHLSQEAGSEGLQVGEEPDMFAMGEEEQQRIRKRDVAVKILGNALWFARYYGTLGAYPPEAKQGKQGTREREQKSSPIAEVNEAGTTKAKKRDQSGLPLFPSKAAATIAVTSTAETSPNEQTPPRKSPEKAAVSRSEPSTGESDQMAANGTTTALPDQQADKAKTLEPAKVSKALQQLASLNAAAGAQMQAKAQAFAAAGADLTADGDQTAVSRGARSGGISATISSKSSHVSLRSLADGTSKASSEAERGETAALEKAEREYAERIGKGCAEWAKMVVCKICFDLHVAGESTTVGSRLGRHGRSGTITAENRGDSKEKARRRREENGSQQTIGKKQGASSNLKDHETSTVEWKPDVFEGASLFGSPMSFLDSPDSIDRVRYVGGTFKVYVQDEEEGYRILELLRILVSACGI